MADHSAARPAGTPKLARWAMTALSGIVAVGLASCGGGGAPNRLAHPASATGSGNGLQALGIRGFSTGGAATQGGSSPTGTITGTPPRPATSRTTAGPATTAGAGVGAPSAGSAESVPVATPASGATGSGSTGSAAAAGALPSSGSGSPTRQPAPTTVPGPPCDPAVLAQAANASGDVAGAVTVVRQACISGYAKAIVATIGDPNNQADAYYAAAGTGWKVIVVGSGIPAGSASLASIPSVTLGKLDAQIP